MAQAVPLEPVRFEGVADFVDQRPFTALALVGVPTVSAILFANLRSSLADGGKLSVVLMHTRVVGQFAVLGLLVGAMVFSGNGPAQFGARHARAVADQKRQHELIAERTSYITSSSPATGKNADGKASHEDHA